MFRKVAIVGIAILVLAGSATAQGRWGIGIILGEPTGISGKLWTSERTAIDAAAAWSFSDDAAFHLHADYLLHNFDLIEVDRGKLPVYFGVGGRVKFESDSKVGVRIPVGLTYIFEGMPIDIFFEVVPLLDLIPEASVTSSVW